ncbi:MAG TPA: two-component regulator propeller domain-containing protein [Ignavibacteria bacterium]|nr:two-component regulator propeller domain-containing protein [Ignavibacteria bacterium]
MHTLNKIRFNQLSIEHGLSQSVVDCIIQDHRGFMWFGTQDGLNKYDGYKFTVYRNDPENINSISNNMITCLYEDNSGDLWIGTATGGLNKYDRENDCFINFMHDENDPDSLSSNIVRSVFEDSDGILWVSTTNGGINKFLRNKNIFKKYNPEENNTGDVYIHRVRQMVEDDDKNIWIATWGRGVIKFDRKADKFISYENKNNIVDSNRINSLFIDRYKKLWVCTNHGLQNLNMETGEIIEYTYIENSNDCISSNLVSTVFEDSNGTLWVGTKESGLDKFDRKNEKFKNYKQENNDNQSLCCDSVYSLYEDRSGILWIGTNGKGLSYFNIKKRSFSHYRDFRDDNGNIASNLISGICEQNKETLWFGTIDSGLIKYEIPKNKFTLFKHSDTDNNTLNDDRVTTIVCDEKENLWIGTYGGGLNKLNLKEEKFTSYKRSKDEHINSISANAVSSITVDKEGNIWLGTGDRGLNKFDPENEVFTNYYFDKDNKNGLSSDRIRFLYCDNEGKIWIGLDVGGLDKFDPAEGKFENFNDNPAFVKSIKNNSVYGICEDKKGRLWIGTSGGGLVCYDKIKNEFVNYQEKDGLPNNFINTVLEDDNGFIWVSTNNGLSRFDTERKLFRNYDERDGLQSNEFNHLSCLKLKNGSLIFGGVNGLNAFHPDDLIENKQIPQIAFTDFRIFNKNIPIGEKKSPLRKSINEIGELELNYRDSVFSFEFAALDFNIPGKNQYAYKMEGFDKGWVLSGNRRFVTYTNLNPGEYIFRVKGSNNDGIWNEKGVSLKIKITPPFWKTLWFKGIGLLAVAGAAAGFYKNKLKKIEKEQKAQTEFTKQLIEVQESDKKRISAELHDSIGNDLLITKNKIQLSLKNPGDSKSLVENLKEVSEIITDTLKDVREISYSLHPYQIERLGLSKAIKSISDRAGSSTGINFIFNSDNIDNILKPEVEINLYRIIQECINNIIKHSKADSVILNISRSENNLIILISDNGTGFILKKVKENTSDHGFGLKGISERIKLFNGKYELSSSPENGTEVKIKVPI